MNHTISVKSLTEHASILKSDDGENEEYDRALVELVMYASGRNSADFSIVQAQIGIAAPEPEESEETYRIVRKHFDSNHPDHNKEINTELSLEEAQDHCGDPDTSEKGVWMDVFEKE